MSAPRSAMRSRPLRVALSGYYGFLNEGDEAVLRGLVYAFYTVSRNTGIETDLTALSIRPEWTTADHGIPAAHRYRIGALLRTISRCDLLASGGGSLLQDVTSRHSIFYYLGVVRAAQIMGKKTMFIAQGIGPLNLPRSRHLTASVARQCDAITVRDAGSATLLQELGVPATTVTLTADPALLLAAGAAAERRIKRPRPQSLQFLARELVPTESITLALRPWGNEPERTVAMVADAIESAGLGGTVGAIFPCSPDDLGVSRSAADRLGPNKFDIPPIPQSPFGRAQDGSSDVYASVRGLIQATQQAEMVIGMRLHSIIAAAAGGVPSVALSYDPKVKAFMDLSGQADAVFDLQSPDPTQLPELLSHVWAHRHDRAELIRFLLPSLRAAALRNAEVAINILTQ